MQKKWLTYGFLGVMTLSLITLAVLQYHWLGSVSEAEKERLEESMEAASENFVADFNRVFTELAAAFRIQVSDRETDYRTLISQSYLNWIRTSEYPRLVEQVYVINRSGDAEHEVLQFSSDPLTLSVVEPDSALQLWIDNEFNDSESESRVSLRVQPDLGDPSFLSIPIQLLDMVQVSNWQTNERIQVRLNIDQLDDIVLLQLNDDVIRKEVIPEIAGTYFSDSFNEQYYLSILKDDEQRYFYYTNTGSDNIPEPDFSSSLDRFNVSSIFIMGDRGSSASDNFSLPNFSNGQNSNVEIKLNDQVLKEGDEVGTTTNAGEESKKVVSSFYSEHISSVTLNDSSTGESRTMQSDTTITSNLVGTLSASPWKLWLTYKEGSLDAFVNKTRNRNLIISFGILGILGVSVVLIVIFSQRSRELAEQQMLFVAGVSHELRTPLTVIRSAAENLTEGVVQDEQRKKEYAHLMLREGRRLSDMVDQIMEFSGIQTGRRIYNFTKVNVHDLLESLKEESRLLLDEKGMQLEYSVGTSSRFVQADPDALFLAVSNLINNAIKFSGNSKKIILKVDNAELKGDPAIQFQVQDFGIGIPAEEQREIFKPFYRGRKASSEQLKGNGIGLSLVRKVAQAHGGTISVKSAVDEGSVFILTIPLRAVHE